MAKNRADGPITTGAMRGDEPRHRTVSAKGQPLPRVTAPASVFAVGQAAKPAKPSKLPPIDVSQLEIRRDPLPPMRPGIKRCEAREVLDAMGPGTNVFLPASKARSIATWGNKHGYRCRVRMLSEGRAGLWREK